MDGSLRASNVDESVGTVEALRFALVGGEEVCFVDLLLEKRSGGGPTSAVFHPAWAQVKCPVGFQPALGSRLRVRISTEVEELRSSSVPASYDGTVQS